jgi:Holliday junction DNA helicase RuvA
VVNELKDKAAHVMSIVPIEDGGGKKEIDDEDVVEVIDNQASNDLSLSNKSAQADALSALQNLGYTPGDSAAAVAKVLHESSDVSTEELIRASLKMLSRIG